ncbi:type II toxin-antitoxin system Phd/YefM family antitoxin [Actinokineospora globicatena]|uniref:Antitoxin n=1 Tax=Actinokineospora globicatena TaxID=103729 RepID=A0A9W6QNK4_9PSEU|nr:type II toxin-antitoxin system prevent-host-death family antitoxin [Actinokineospora globicatena]GLW91764.1 hypothetical protein Aglo03_25800 [Actinokineospora globicatena]
METTPPTSVSVAVLRADLASLLNAVEWQGHQIEITRYNRPAAYLVSAEWFERAQRALASEE